MRTRLAVVLAGMLAFLLAPAVSMADLGHVGTCLTATGLPCSAFAGETYAGFTLDASANDTKEAVDAVLTSLSLVDDVTFVAKLDPPGDQVTGDFTITNSTGQSFDWAYGGTLTLAYLTVKADSGFAIFDISGQILGSIDISDASGLDFSNHAISHFSFWSTDQPLLVAEPSMLLLAGLGFLGTAYLGRRWRRDEV